MVEVFAREILNLLVHLALWYVFDDALAHDGV